MCCPSARCQHSTPLLLGRNFLTEGSGDAKGTSRDLRGAPRGVDVSVRGVRAALAGQRETRTILHYLGRLRSLCADKSSGSVTDLKTEKQ